MASSDRCAGTLGRGWRHCGRTPARWLGLLVAPALWGSLAWTFQSSPAVPERTASPGAVRAPAGEATQEVGQIQDLLDTLARFDRNRSADRKIGFELPERAINEYLAWVLKARPRAGISAATVTLADNEIAAQVRIDFDALGNGGTNLLAEPWGKALTGQRDMRVTVQFEAQKGLLTFKVKEAHDADGKPIPNQVMAEVIQALARRQPEAYDTTKPVPLPFGLKRVWIGQRSLCGET
jgi:hypothetical protein